MNLQLREMLWEITSDCDKGCDYCGSKDIINNGCFESELVNIANQIVDIGTVKEVTLTGGEPGMLAIERPDVFDDVINILIDGGVEVKIVTNGKIFDADIDFDKISVFGLSVNKAEDIDMYDELIDECKKDNLIKGNIVIITNFGKHNIWDFDKFTEFVGDKKWQIQLTMGDQQLNGDGIKYLRDLINKSGSDFVFADNLQIEHECMAGIMSASITYDCKLVACLSERTTGNIKYYGSLLESNLKQLWENEFKDIRFECDHKCCRDFINYPAKLDYLRDAINKQCEESAAKESVRGNARVILYGVINPNRGGDWDMPPPSSQTYVRGD